ncbi:hypothetical protein Tco_0788266 [Tanacetum coccineum]
MSNDGYLHRYLGHVALSLEVYSFSTTGRIKGLELTHRKFIAITTSVNHSETPVLMEKFNFQDMLKAVERFKVTYMSVFPSLVVAMVKSEVASPKSADDHLSIFWSVLRLERRSHVTLLQHIEGFLGIMIVEWFEKYLVKVHLDQLMLSGSTAGSGEEEGLERVLNWVLQESSHEARVLDCFVKKP